MGEGGCVVEMAETKARRFLVHAIKSHDPPPPLQESSPLKRLPVKPNSMSGAAWAHIVAGVWQNGSADGNSRR